jgi:hypothetical protein
MHDKNGRPINIGDKVTIVGTVTKQSNTPDGMFCSVGVEIEGDWDGKGNTKTEWFSTKEVEVQV